MQFVFSMLLMLALFIFMIASMWKIFEKAGEPGWAAIVPIYNVIVMLKIAGRPLWWILLLLIPLVNFVIWVIVALDVAKAFGKNAGYGVGLLLLPFVFYPMLGFGVAKFQGAGAGGAPAAV